MIEPETLVGEFGGIRSSDVAELRARGIGRLGKELREIVRHLFESGVRSIESLRSLQVAAGDARLMRHDCEHCHRNRYGKPNGAYGAGNAFGGRASLGVRGSELLGRGSRIILGLLGHNSNPSSKIEDPFHLKHVPDLSRTERLAELQVTYRRSRGLRDQLSSTIAVAVRDRIDGPNGFHRNGGFNFAYGSLFGGGNHPDGLFHKSIYIGDIRHVAEL